MEGPVTLDASVLVRSSALGGEGQEDCDRALLVLGERHVPIVLPTLVLVELAGALARRGKDPLAVERVLERVRTLPVSMFLPLDSAMADEAGALALEYRMRGADAVYVVTARRAGSTLITVDEEQRSRVPDDDVTTMPPAEFLAAVNKD